MTEELWRPIPEWPYEVSNFGRVRRTTPERGTWPGHILEAWKSEKGYLQVCLYGGDRTRKYRFVHNLVLEAFIGPCPPGFETDHLNRNHADNRLANLRWFPKELNRGLYGEDHSQSRLTNIDVIKILALYVTGEWTYRGLGREFGVSFRTVGDILSGKTWRHITAP